MLCLTYYCLYFLFNKIRDKSRTDSAWKGWGEREGMWGVEGRNAPNNVCTYKKKKIKKKKKKKQKDWLGAWQDPWQGVQYLPSNRKSPNSNSSVSKIIKFKKKPSISNYKNIKQITLYKHTKNNL
jgi:hypothetical protein